MAKLNLYCDDKEREYVAIITNPNYAKDLLDDGMHLIESHDIEGDVSSYPDNRLLIQE